MVKSFKSLLEVMVPQSAKKGSDIDNQWLEPASYDKKMVAAMKGEPENIYDCDAPENLAYNFRAQDLVKKNKKLPLMGRPLSEDDAEATSTEGLDSVNAAYEEEALELLEEIMDIIDGIDEDEAPRYGWRYVARALKEARDFLLSSVVSESMEYLDEDFKEGKFKLKDGSNVKLTKEDAKVLNFALSGTNKKEEMIDELSKNKHEFNQFLAFARSLKEDYEPTLASLMEDLSIEDLNYIAENELSEAELWNHIRAGGSAGAAVGSTIGTVAGGVFGASLGAGVAASKSINRYLKNRKLKKAGVADYRMIKTRDELDEANNQNNKKQSILGTSAPALDSDPNNAKSKKLQESGGIGGHPANYRNPVPGYVKYNTITTPVKPGEVLIIANNKKNIDGPLATKVGDIVNVKFSRVEFFRMRVIEMLPDNQIKVQAGRW